MQSRNNGRQLILVGIVVIVLVLGIGFFLMNRGGGGSVKANSPTGTVPVVVAQQAIPQGTIFKAGENLNGLFQVKPVPTALAPFGAYSKVSQITALTKTQGCGPVQANG